MLAINPKKRYSAEECLKHPYFEDLHEEEYEPSFEGTIDFSFEKNENITLEEIRI